MRAGHPSAGACLQGTLQTASTSTSTKQRGQAAGGESTGSLVLGVGLAA